MHKTECVTSAVVGPPKRLVEGAQSCPDLEINESRCKNLVSKLMEWELILSVAAGIVTSLPCVKPIRFKKPIRCVGSPIVWRTQAHRDPHHLILLINKCDS